jgi:hypothetical protein
MATKRSATKKKSSKQVSGKERDIDLRFILPPDLPLLYVDNIQVTHTQSEFLISFMQSRPPLMMSEKEWDSVKSIESMCVARIMLNPMKMQAFVSALNNNFRKYVQNYIQQEPPSEAENPKTGNGANGRKPV